MSVSGGEKQGEVQTVEQACEQATRRVRRDRFGGDGGGGGSSSSSRGRSSGGGGGCFIGRGT